MFFFSEDLDSHVFANIFQQFL